MRSYFGEDWFWSFGRGFNICRDVGLCGGGSYPWGVNDALLDEEVVISTAETTISTIDISVELLSPEHDFQIPECISELVRLIPGLLLLVQLLKVHELLGDRRNQLPYLRLF